MSYGYQDHLFNLLLPFSEKLGPRRSGFYFRKNTLDLLGADSRVELNSIQRNHWGLLTGPSDEQRKRQRLEYDENISSNMFTLCVRGAGNFSLRLFEVLSSGRIPLLVDTDDIRPCEDKLNYEDFVLS